jgi:hypothetical protein
MELADERSGLDSRDFASLEDVMDGQAHAHDDTEPAAAGKLKIALKSKIVEVHIFAYRIVVVLNQIIIFKL